MNVRNFILFGAVLLLTVLQANAQQRQAMEEFSAHEWKTFREYVRLGEQYIPDTLIDVKFYYLDLEIAIDSPYIQGQVTCIFEPLAVISEVRLSLNSSLTVSQVKGNAGSFLQTGDSLIISLDNVYGPGDQPFVTIDYYGVPVLAGGYKGLRYETHHGDEPIIATLSTPYLAHYWYPCKDGPSDKPDSVYVDITIPVKVVNGIEVSAVSNGILENVIDNTTEKTYQWRHRYPVVPYYVMVAISNFVHFSEDYTGIYGEQYPLDYYVFQQDLSASQEGVEDMPLALDVFSEYFGEYPFSAEKYGMTQLGFYGAIENQTNTITNNMFPSWFMISVHELGHMWFGDMITCRNWHHAWLNEGFASYSEAVYTEAVEGFEAYSEYMEDFEYWSGGTLYLQDANDTFNIFQGIIYNKGAYVLHMLRGVMGDNDFFDGLYAYATDPDLMYGQAVTEDFQQVCEEISGDDLDYFFEQWVYDAYYPVYHYNYELDPEGLAFVIRQVQGDMGRRPVFEMPLQVSFTFAGGGDTLLTVWNDETEQLYITDIMEEVTSMTIDPDSWVLCQSYYHPEIPVGLDELPRQEPQNVSVTFYPHPVSDHANFQIVLIDGITFLNMDIYDLNGRKTVSLINLCEGRHTIVRDKLSPGMYLYTLRNSKSGEFLGSGKIILK